MLDLIEKQLDRILAIVAKCPDHLQEKCFEILLAGLVQAQQPRAVAQTGGVATQPLAPPSPPSDSAKDDFDIPAEVSARFRTTAKRLDLKLDQLAGLFDFHTDPFVYHAIHVPGKSKAERTRNVGLLVGARSYLTTGQWVADLKEVRARCVDQNCYDNTNFRKYMEGGGQSLFSVSEDSARLTPAGVKAAEALLTTVATSSE